MASAGDIINAAYRKIGIANAEIDEQNNALEALNDLLGIWGAEYLFPYVVRESFALTSADTYTIGSGGTLNTVRPIKISSLYLRDSNNNDYPIKIMSAKKYNDMTIKGQSGRPTRVYLIPEYPLAKIIFNYAPDTAYTAYFDFIKNFTEASSTLTTISLPNEYKAFLKYNLAIVLAEDKKIILPPTVYQLAAQYKDIIDRLNASVKVTPTAIFDMNIRRDYLIETDDYAG